MSLHHSVDGVVQFFTSTQTLAKTTPGAQQAGLVLLSCLLYFRLAAHESVLSTDCKNNNSNNNNINNNNNSRIEIPAKTNNATNVIDIKPIKNLSDNITNNISNKDNCTFNFNDNHDVCLINKLQSLSI